MMRKSNTLCVVCSAGGHLTEALRAIEGINIPYYIVTYKLPHISESLKGEDVFFVTNPHKNPFKYLPNFVQSLFIYMAQKPKFILSTGSGMAIPTCIIGKTFGSKIIFIETGARVTQPSMTGKFMYRISDLFIVQWETLLQFFPSAQCGGPLI